MTDQQVEENTAPIESSALHLVRHVWSHNREGTRHSWQRLNASMHDALALAIRAGLTFGADDFRTIYDTIRGNYWFGDGAGSCVGERFYSLAIEFGHSSAYQSFERFAGRKPYLFAGRRLYVGCDFNWDARTVRVTSLRPESMIACTYSVEKDAAYPRERVAKRYAITHQELRAASATNKKDSPEHAGAADD